MTKYRVFTDNGDILFYGNTLKNEGSRPPRYQTWNRLVFQGSPAQHAALTVHLNRHDRSWSFQNDWDGKVIYDLPPYFKLTEVQDDADESDAAVKAPTPDPLRTPMIAPTFPAPHAADPYTRIIDVNWALKGERFRAEWQVSETQKIVRYGTFAMDGNAVSPDYGWFTFEMNGENDTAGVKRRAYGPESGKQYINVHFDDRPEGYYDNSVRRDDRAGIAYTPAGAGWPNEGLSPDQDGLKIYGLPEVAERRVKAVKDLVRAQNKRNAERKLADAEQAVINADKALTRARLALRDI